MTHVPRLAAASVAAVLALAATRPAAAQAAPPAAPVGAADDPLTGRPGAAGALAVGVLALAGSVPTFVVAALAADTVARDGGAWTVPGVTIAWGLALHGFGLAAALHGGARLRAFAPRPPAALAWPTAYAAPGGAVFGVAGRF
jgi:hypothetical protein